MTLEQTTVESKGDEVTKEVGANLTTNSSASKKAAQAMVSFAAQPAAQPQKLLHKIYVVLKPRKLAIGKAWLMP